MIMWVHDSFDKVMQFSVLPLGRCVAVQLLVWVDISGWVFIFSKNKMKQIELKSRKSEPF